MKKLLLLILAMLLPIVVSAAVEIDGIFYNLDSDKKTAEVTMGKEYSGNVSIPETITYQKITYSVTSIGAWAFQTCSALTSVNIPNSVTNIANFAFNGCTGLTNVTIPNSVTSIESLIFYGCDGLTSITVNKDNKKYDSRDNCNAIIESSTNTLIVGCKSTVIPNSVTSIGAGAFSDCKGLTSITIPNSVTSIGNRAFSGCSNLLSITIPNSVTSIESLAFQSCGLTDLYCYAEVIPTTNMDAFYYSHWAYAILHVPASAIDAYRTTAPWREFGTIVAIEGESESEPEAYAVLSTDKTTLSFYYDGKKNSREGTVFGLNIGSKYPDWYPSYSKSITKVVFDDSFADARPTSTSCWFYGCEKLKEIKKIHNLNTSNVTDMWGMFCRCSELITLDVSGFNTENVTSMLKMFSGCSGLTTLDVSNFDTGNVEDMYSMFYGCSGLTTLDVSGFDTSNVTNMGSMFSRCSGLTTLDVSNFNTGNVKDMNNMFSGCSGLTTLDVSNFNTDKVTNMIAMFKGCSGLTTLDLSNFNTGNVINMFGMFYECSGLTTIYCGDNWNTEKVTDSLIFGKCPNLIGGAGTKYDDGHTDKEYAHVDGGTNNPGYFTYKGENGEPEAYAVLSTDETTLSFYYDSKKNSREGTVYGLNAPISDSGWLYSSAPDWYGEIAHLKKVVFDASFADARPTTTFRWFSDCKRLREIEGINNLNTENVSDMSKMFNGCSGLTSLDLSSFNTGNAKYMFFMFEGCNGLTSLDVSGFNTANVTDMGYMFAGCRGLTTLNVSNFNTANVTNMTCMFSSCSGLTTLDVSNFNTANVTNMSYMFSGCNGLTSLDVSGFNTSNVADMRLMFSGCSGLATIYIGEGWNTDKVTKSSDMFKDCNNLVGGDGTTYSNDYTDASKAYAGIGGYLTLEDGDDLQRYLDSLIDTEDSFEGGVYTRRFLNDDWQTLYVPFEMNYSDWVGRFEVASIGGFYWYDDDDDNYVDRQELVATIVESGSLQANFPYLIRAKSKMGGTLSVKVSGNVSQKVTVAYMEIPPVTYNFVGNYSQLTGLMSAGRYRLQSGSLFIPLNDSEVLLPYRWYMTMDVASTQSVRLNIITNDETTGIENVKRSQWMIQDMQPDAQHPTVFDMSGRRVDADIKSLPKGIYLINNKKCVIK